MNAIWNPYLAEAAPHFDDFGVRSSLQMKQLRLRFAWAIPDECAAAVIKRHAPHGAVEVAAGSGYWKRYLEQFGVMLLSYDIGGGTLANWSNTNWSEVLPGGPEVASSRPDLPLLIVKPTDVPDPNEHPGPTPVSYAARAFDLYRSAGGKVLIHVGLAYWDTGMKLAAGLSPEQLILGQTYMPELDKFPPDWKLIEEVPIPTYDHTGRGPEKVYVFRAD